MILAQALTLYVGTAIMKAVAKLWLKDSPIAEGAAAGAIDVVKKKIEDFDTQRATEKLLNNLQDEVAKRLSNTIAIEFPTLPENDRVAAALAVAAVLEELDLAPEIARQDLDAARLLAAARPLAVRHFKGLGDDGERLADLLLTECCAYVISLAGKLPDFQIAATRELLKRSTTLLDEMAAVLDMVTKIRSEASDNKSREEASFETQYRRALAFKLDRLHLFGLHIVGAGTRDYELSIAYVTLSSTLLGAGKSGSIDQCLPSLRRAVVRGEAGSGKTTLMQWLAVRAANRDFADEMAAWNALMPFYVQLRDYAGGKFPPPERLIESATPNLAGVLPNGWAHRALAAGALLIIDGVDEVPAIHREALFDWLKHLCEDFPASVVVVSSRPAALDAGRASASLAQRLRGLQFESLALEAMSLRDSERLVAHWHAAVGRDRTSDADRMMLERYDQGLRKTLHERPAIQNLASNPLLCAMICALNWDRREDLPSQRMELYRLALDMLLQSRDADRKIQAAHLNTLGPKAKEEILDALAYWMLTNGYSEASLPEVVAQVAIVLRRLASVSAEAAEVTQELLERSGVLRQPQHGMVDFVHRTFLEYMAAREALHSGNAGVLVDRAKEESWRETIVFAAGHAQLAARDKLIGDLLKRPLLGLLPRAVEADVTAICCLETAGSNLDPNLLKRLQDLARRLFPPADFATARILAPAAALDPFLLVGHASLPEPVVAACVRCAAIAGVPQMLSVIETYSTHAGNIVADELLRAWASFDAATYLEHVVARMPLVAALGIDATNLVSSLAEGVGSISAETLRCMQLLVMRGEHLGKTAELVTALQQFQERHSLWLGSNYASVESEVASESMSSRLAALVSASSAAKNSHGLLVSISDADRLASIKSLEFLSLGKSERGVLDKLVGLPRLSELRFNLSGVDSLAALAHMAALESITISGLGAAAPTVARPLDLSPLAQCPRLTKVELAHVGNDDDPRAMVLPLKHLTSLRVAYTPLGFLAKIDTAGKLKELSIQTRKIATHKLRLASLAELRSLDVYAEDELDLELPASLDYLRLAELKVNSIAAPGLPPRLRRLVLSNVHNSPGVLALLAAPSLESIYLSGTNDELPSAALQKARDRGVRVTQS